MSEQIYTAERKNKRRQEDIECAAHEERLDAMDQNIAANKGWLKGTAALLIIVGFISSTFCTIIIGKLSSIQELLSKNDVVFMKHEQQILNHDNRIDAIEKWRQWIEQSRGNGK